MPSGKVHIVHDFGMRDKPVSNVSAVRKSIVNVTLPVGTPVYPVKCLRSHLAMKDRDERRVWAEQSVLLTRTVRLDAAHLNDLPANPKKFSRFMASNGEDGNAFMFARFDFPIHSKDTPNSVVGYVFNLLATSPIIEWTPDVNELLTGLVKTVPLETVVSLIQTMDDVGPVTQAAVTPTQQSVFGGSFANPIPNVNGIKTPHRRADPDEIMRRLAASKKDP